MATLGITDHHSLAKRGITADNNHYGVRISLTSRGMAWLLNYLYSSNQIGATLSLALLKEVARFQPKEGEWRDLRFKAVPIPVYHGENYFQFIFYLNGTPPRAFHFFPPEISAITTTHSVPMTGGAFHLRNDQIVDIEFTEPEVAKLKNGELIVVGSA